MNRLKGYMDRGLLVATATLIVLMALGAIWQVFTRYVLNAPNAYTGELVRIGLVWATMLSASYAFGTNQHLSFTIVRDRLSGARRRFVLVLNSLVILVFAVAVLIVGGIDLTRVTFEDDTPVLLLSRGLVNVSMPVAGTIIVVYQLMELRRIFHGEEQVESTAGERTSV